MFISKKSMIVKKNFWSLFILLLCNLAIFVFWTKMKKQILFLVDVSWLLNAYLGINRLARPVYLGSKFVRSLALPNWVSSLIARLIWVLSLLALHFRVSSSLALPIGIWSLLAQPIRVLNTHAPPTWYNSGQVAGSLGRGHLLRVIFKA